MVNYNLYLILSVILFFIGIVGVIINKKNIVIVLMSIEVILLACNLNLVFFSNYLGDEAGIIFTLFIISIAAAEVAIGLALVTVLYRLQGNIDIESLASEEESQGE